MALLFQFPREMQHLNTFHGAFSGTKDTVLMLYLPTEIFEILSS